MPNRITTEEAERIAERIQCYHGADCTCQNAAAAAALRSLAAERGELRKALALKADDAYRAGYAAGSGENQP